MIIQNDIIDAAACILPLTESTMIDPEMGTRHRAALGISEETDAIVVLSGMVKPIKRNSVVHYEFSEAVDRIFAGINLLKMGKAQKIILTRGKLPWSIGVPEGEFLAEFIQSQGIDPNRILLTEIVQNTNDEAKAISKMLPKNSEVILVTSAFHMPRAEKVFQNQKTPELIEIFDLLLDKLSQFGISKLIYKSIPRIYHQAPAEEDVYALFLKNASLVSCETLSIVEMANRIPIQARRRRGVKKAKRQNIIICE